MADGSIPKPSSSSGPGQGGAVLEQADDHPGLPEAGGQPLARLRRARRGADERDHLVDVRQGHREPLQDVRPRPRPLQLEDRAPRHHFAPVADEAPDDLLQIEGARLAVDQRHHVDPEHRLELGVPIELVQEHLGHRIAAHLGHDPDPVLVRFVAKLGNAFDLAGADELGNLLDELRLVHLVGNLGEHHAGTLVPVPFLHVGRRPEVDAPAPGVVRLADPGRAVDGGASREIGAGQVLHQPVDADVGVVQVGDAGVEHLAGVVGRHVRRHAHRDPGRAVHEEVRDAGRQDHRLALGAVVVRDEVDRLLVEVGQQLVGDARHPDLGVAHRGRRIAVHGAEVALAVDEHLAHRERLGHPDDRVVDRGLAVRVVLADDVADDAGGFLVRPVPVVSELVHRVENAPVHRLQPVPHVRQGTPHDDAHRVIEVGLPELLLDVYVTDFLGKFSHGSRTRRRGLELGKRRSGCAESRHPRGALF